MWALLIAGFALDDPGVAKPDNAELIATSCIFSFFLIFAVRARLHAVANPLARTTSRAALWSAWTGLYLAIIAAHAGPTVPGQSISVTWNMITKEFLWHALDAVPAVQIPAVVGWEEPLKDYDAVTGILLLAMRVVVLIGVIDMLTTFFKNLRGKSRSQPEFDSDDLSQA